jgi:hypothetical protein
MHTPTFWQKITSSWPSWQSFLLLLTLVAGIASPESTLAQTTVNFRRAFVATGTGSSTVTTKTYNANIISSNGSNGAFDGTNFGSFDLSASQLLLQGGEVEVIEDPNETYPTATIYYGIKQGNLNSSGTNSIPQLSGILQLTQVSYDAATRTRRFSLDNQRIDILALATTGGAGTSYRFDLRVDIGPGEDSDGNPLGTLLGGRRRSVFTATGNPITPPTLTPNTIFIAPNAGANVTYNVNPATPRPFNNGDLSSANNNGTTYDITSGQLLLNGASVTTTQNGPNNVSSVLLYYRVRSGSDASAYQSVVLNQTANNNGTKTFYLDNGQINLIGSGVVLSPGTYYIDVFFQANVSNSNNPGTITSITTPANTNSPYSASFTVVGNLSGTVWTGGGKNDNWFDPSNWSTLSVPTSATDVTIRYESSIQQYPNIYSDAVNTSSGYDNTSSGPALARNIRLTGPSNSQTGILRLSAGRLKIFGDFVDDNRSFAQRDNTVTEFAGTNQSIDNGGIFGAVEISGGGIKRVGQFGNMRITQSLKFISGVLATFTGGSSSIVELVGQPDITTAGAQIIDENDQNYLLGSVLVSNVGVSVGETRTYGNIGLTMTFKGSNSPNGVVVTRVTDFVYNAMGDRYSIRRYFKVVPTNQATSSGGLRADLVFHYMDSETRNLGPSNVTIQENNLSLFESTNSGATFQQLGKNLLDTDNNLLTKYDVTTFAILTLGDVTMPLPVVLTAFTTTRINTNALLTWATASEQNNKGFEVQVATDGATYRTLAFVASNASTTTKTSTYQYLDTEANKIGVRYYRLHQIDLDGKDSYSPVRTVSFTSGEVLGATLVAAPNPFTDKLAFSFNGITPSVGTAQLTLVDMVGRIVLTERLALSSASMEISNLTGLRTGLYVARILLPDGSTKTVRVQKQ